MNVKEFNIDSIEPEPKDYDRAVGLATSFDDYVPELRLGIKIIDGLVCATVIADIFLVHFNNTPGLVNYFLTWF